MPACCPRRRHASPCSSLRARAVPPGRALVAAGCCRASLFALAGTCLTSVPAQSQHIAAAIPVGQLLVSFSATAEPAIDARVMALERAFHRSLSARTRRALYAQRGDDGATTTTQAVALPRGLLSRRYILLDSAGIHLVRPRALLVERRVRWADSAARIASVAHSAAIEGSVVRASSGGFVMVMESPALPRPIGPPGLSDSVALAARARTAAGVHPGTAIVAWYRLQLPSAAPNRWLFVQWAADSTSEAGGCARRFALFRLLPSVRLEARSASGCDV